MARKDPSNRSPRGHRLESTAGTADGEKTHNISPRRRRAFFAITLAIPIILVGALEGALRLFNYGQDLSLFTTQAINGTTYYLLNHQVKARYFPNVSFAQTTSLDYFVMPKPAGHFRIFILGGSTAAGYPYGSNASFASFLRQRLSAIFPERAVEVINLGMTATNSYTVLDLARELPAYQPDLLIVYDGHNEFYGGLGINSQGLWGGSRFMSLLYLRLIHTRTFLLARDVYTKLRALLSGESRKAPRDVSMELLGEGKFVPYGNAVYLAAEKSFAANLEDLREITRDARLPLILSTQVSNLRGQPPFASGDTSRLTADVLSSFNARRRAGKLAWDQHRWTDALDAYSFAERIDTMFAQVHFAIARCLDVLGQRDRARTEYVIARDYDELRFRTSSDFNRRIVNMDDGKSVGVVDMESLFMAASPDSLIGNELILEHLHPNTAGYFLMARGYAEEMRRMGVMASTQEWEARDTVSDRRLWDDRPTTPLDERIAIERTANLTSGWPFTERALSVPPTLPRDTLEGMARKVIEGVWGTGDAHQAAAEYFRGIGDARDAEREYRTVIALDPLKLDSYWNLADLYRALNRFDDYAGVLQASLTIHETPRAHAALGQLNAQIGNSPAAESEYRKALDISESQEDLVSNGYELATVLMRENRGDQAESEILKVLSISPQHQPALTLLHAIQRNRQKK